MFYTALLLNEQGRRQRHDTEVKGQTQKEKVKQRRRRSNTEGKGQTQKGKVGLGRESSNERRRCTLITRMKNV